MPRPVLGNYDGAVVSGFFFGTRTVQWVSAIADVSKCFENTALCEAVLVSPPTTTVLQTLPRGRYLPAWKKRVTQYDLGLGGSSRTICAAG